MKICFSIFLFVACFCNSNVHAQVPNEPAIDSIQRVLLKDSLGVNDSIVTAIFVARDNFLAFMTEMGQDTITKPVIKKALTKQMAIQTNKKIKLILGNSLYEQYRGIIQRWMALRRPNDATDPLATAY